MLTRRAPQHKTRPRAWRLLAWIVGGGSLIALGGGYTLSGQFDENALADIYPLGAVRIGGELDKVTKQELIEVIAPYARDGFFNTDVERVRHATESLSWVKRASVRRVWPARLEVEVIEHKALARWAPGGLVNEQGKLFSPPVKSSPEGLPLLSGPMGTERKLLGRYQRLTEVFSSILGEPEKLILNEQGIWRAVFPGPVTLIYRESQWAGMQAFRGIYSSLLVSLSLPLSRIDLRYPNGFSVRWKNSTRPLKAPFESPLGKEYAAYILNALGHTSSSVQIVNTESKL